MPAAPALKPAIVIAAREIAAKIAAQLDADMDALTVAISREEAVLAQGLLEGAAVALEREGKG